MLAQDKFDPLAYKATTHKQWDSAAEAWHRWGPTLEEWLGNATELMLDLASIGPGSRVLDVAAGAGGQTIAAARRVGSTGSVLATDISLEILQYAKESATGLGLNNVEILQADGEELRLPPGFDAAISRVGLIYFLINSKPLQAFATVSNRADGSQPSPTLRRKTTRSSRSLLASSAAEPACRLRSRAGRARSAWERTACSKECSSKRASLRSKSARSMRR
jgi:SAM-dependent methyltransferase